MAHTGYSLADLQDWFYNCLNGRIKDELVHTAQPINILYKLIAVTSDLDIQIWQCEAEKNCKQGHSRAYIGTRTVWPTVPTIPTMSYNPFIPSWISMPLIPVRSSHTKWKEGAMAVAYQHTFKKTDNMNVTYASIAKELGIRRLFVWRSFSDGTRGKRQPWQQKIVVQSLIL